MNFSFGFVTNCHRKLLNMISRQAKIKLNTQFEYYSNNAANWFIDKPKYSVYDISVHLCPPRLPPFCVHGLKIIVSVVFYGSVICAARHAPPRPLPIRPQLLAGGGRNVRNQFWPETPLARSASRSTSSSIVNVIS